MFKLLKSYLKDNIKIILLVVLTMSISVGGAFSVMLAEHSEYTNHYLFQKENGALYGARAQNLSLDEVKKISSSDSVRDSFYVSDFGEFIDSRGKKISVECFDKNVQKLYKLHLKHGRYPQKNNEAVVLNSSNSFKLGEVADGRLLFENTRSKQKNIVLKDSRIKIVGIVENPILEDSMKNDFLYLKLDNEVVEKSQAFYTMYINFKSGYDNLEAETAKLVSNLGLNMDQIYYNRDVSQTNSLMKNLSLENPRFKNLVFSGIFFSLVTLIIYSKKRIQDMKLLRIVGASKKQVIFILASEGIVISVISFILGNLFGLSLAKLFINNINYTLASEKIYLLMSKKIHYDVFFSIYTLKIILLPIVLAFLYQLVYVNFGAAKSSDKNFLSSRFEKLIRLRIFKRGRILSKVSSINFRKNIIYLIVPIVLLALPMSNFISTSNSYDRDKNMSTDFGSTGLDTLFALRHYKVDRENYYTPEFGFSDEEVDNLRNVDGISEVLPFLDVPSYLISDKDMLDPKFFPNVSENDEVVFDIFSFDRSYIENKGVILDDEVEKKDIEDNENEKLNYGDIKNNKVRENTSSYPRAYIKDKFYDREADTYQNLFKNIKTGDILRIKLPVKTQDGLDFKEVGVEVAGFIDSSRISTFITTRNLVGGIYMDPEEFEKVAGYKRFSTIYFNSDKDIVSEKIRELGKESNKRAGQENSKEGKSVDIREKNVNDVEDKIGDSLSNSFNFMSIRDARDEGNGKTSVFLEMYMSLVYAGVISIFTIFSSLKIIRSMRKREDEIILKVGASKNSIRKMYIFEGLRYGLFSAAITLCLSLYDILETHFYLKEVFDNLRLNINIPRLVLGSLVPFMIFFISYVLGTAKDRDLRE